MKIEGWREDNIELLRRTNSIDKAFPDTDIRMLNDQKQASWSKRK
jgi:hypothetical protein